MKDCKKCEKLLDKALYGELTGSEEKFFHEHLGNCNDCRMKYEELNETLDLVKGYKRPDPDESFMENLWENIEPELKDKKSWDKSWWLNLINSLRFEPKSKYQLAGGLALLLVGLFIGKFLLNNNTANNQIHSDNKKELDITAANNKAIKYLDRSKILLLGLINFDTAKDDAETINLPHIQKISRQLVNQAPGLKANLKDPSQQQLKRLVSDLQLILMQIANLEAKKDIEGIELIKDGVKSGGIFLKINIQELMKSNEGNSKKQTPENGDKKVKQNI